MTPPRLVGLLLVLLGALGLLVLPATPALAHTERVGVSPAPGSSTTGTVPAVEIDFSDEVLPGLARVVVRDARGRDHVAGRIAVLGGRVSARLEDIGPGRYRVDYRVVADDGHPVTGSYRFRVTAGATGTTGTTGGATAGTATSPAPAVEPAATGRATGRATGARHWGFPALLVGVLVLSASARWRLARRTVRP
jgi:methionine-rich copper-binding protein CopC